MKPTLTTLDLAIKLLLSTVLTSLMAGFIVSEAYVARTLHLEDGQPGLSLADIIYKFHGDRTMSPLKRQSLGSMKRYFSASEDPRRLADEEQADLDTLVAWSERGAPERDYWDPELKRKKPGAIYRILERHACLDCHAPTSTTIGNKKESPLNTFAAIRRFTAPDQGMDVGRLLLLSHIHLPAITLLFLFTGLLCAHSRRSQRTRSALAMSGPLAVIITITGFWVTKLWGPAGAWIVLSGGVAMPLIFALSTILILVDLWRPANQ
ncbi:MAG: hypothetical protein MUF51_02295 [Vicinamibacteria bacterium]|nr:hypothetical protein [Vicinamibacteria bacterium]